MDKRESEIIPSSLKESVYVDGRIQRFGHVSSLIKPGRSPIWR